MMARHGALLQDLLFQTAPVPVHLPKILQLPFELLCP